MIVPDGQPWLAPYMLGATVGVLQGLLLRLGVSGAVRWTLSVMWGISAAMTGLVMYRLLALRHQPQPPPPST